MAENIEIALIDELKHIFKVAHDLTNGKCGITMINIMDATGEDWKKLEPHLRQLHQEKYFRVRKGINGNLYFLNAKK